MTLDLCRTDPGTSRHEPHHPRPVALREMGGHAATTGPVELAVPHLPLYYDSTDSEHAARQLILTLYPNWEQWREWIQFDRFTDGITNTVSSTRVATTRRTLG